jgi:hypothetical protein
MNTLSQARSRYSAGQDTDHNHAAPLDDSPVGSGSHQAACMYQRELGHIQDIGVRYK